jgi:hypothetical protein
LFICLRPAKLVLMTRGSSGAAMSQMLGVEAQVPRDGPRAAPDREAGAEATEARDDPGAVPSREAGAGATRTRGGRRKSLS